MNNRLLSPLDFCFEYHSAFRSPSNIRPNAANTAILRFNKDKVLMEDIIDSLKVAKTE